LEAEIIYLEKKHELIDQSSKIYDTLESKDKEINQNIKSINDQIKLQKHSDIRRIFNSFIKEILASNAILSLKLNKEGNVEYDASIQRPDDLTITEEDYGTSYRKLLCIAFDISLILNYRNQSFYRFSYHDGALEALDNRKKLLFIQALRRICSDSNIQQIITLIDSDLPKSTTHQPIQFENNEYILTLSDEEDDSGRLFGFSF
jgi:uncharacterized protein YydD (DUF2326 family)